MSMRVPDSWKGGEGMFKCGLCVKKNVVGDRNENEKLKREMEQMKNEDDKRKEAGVAYMKIMRILKYGQPLGNV